MDASPHPIRVAIAGYGVSGELSHADPISTLQDFQICAVCDLSEDRRGYAEDKHQCKTYEAFSEMLAEANPDLVCIITRSDTHCSLACEALGKGIHVLVTKPWALNLKEGLKIMEALQRGAGELFPWIPLYWSPDYRKIQELTQAGAIGDVFKIRRYITDFRKRYDWQTENRYGGGYLLNWGAHIVQPILGLAGRPLRKVFGRFQQVINPGDTEDNFTAHLVFEGGLEGIAEFTQAIEGLPPFLMQGTRGTILSDESRTVLLQKDPDSQDPPVRQEFPHPSKYFGDEQEIYRDVAKAIRGEAAFPVTPEQALEGTRVLDAIRQSAETGEVVTLV